MWFEVVWGLYGVVVVGWAGCGPTLFSSPRVPLITDYWFRCSFFLFFFAAVWRREIAFVSQQRRTASVRALIHSK